MSIMSACQKKDKEEGEELARRRAGGEGARRGVMPNQGHTPAPHHGHNNNNNNNNNTNDNNSTNNATPRSTNSTSTNNNNTATKTKTRKSTNRPTNQ